MRYIILIAFIFAVTLVNCQVKISELPTTTTPVSGDVIPMSKSGTTYKVTKHYLQKALRDSLQAALDSIANHVVILNAHEGRVDNLDDSVAAHVVILNTHEGRVDNLDDSVAAHVTILNTHEGRVDAIDDTLALHIDTLNAHNGRIDAVEARTNWTFGKGFYTSSSTVNLGDTTTASIILANGGTDNINLGLPSYSWEDVYVWADDDISLRAIGLGGSLDMRIGAYGSSNLVGVFGDTAGFYYTDPYHWRGLMYSGANTDTTYWSDSTLVTMEYVKQYVSAHGGDELGDTITQLWTQVMEDTIALTDVVRLLEDSTLLWCWDFTDSAQFVSGHVVARFFHSGPDTLAIEGARAGCVGSGANFSYNVSYADTLSEAGTNLWTSNLIVTGTETTGTGEIDTSPNNPSIPPGNWVMLDFYDLTAKPEYGCSFNFYGYEY